MNVRATSSRRGRTAVERVEPEVEPVMPEALRRLVPVVADIIEQCLRLEAEGRITLLPCTEDDGGSTRSA